MIFPRHKYKKRRIDRQMTSKDRVLTALKGQEPDRIPTFEWDIDHHVIHALCPECEYFDFIDRMNLDAVVVSPNYESEIIEEDILRDEWGVIRKKGLEAYPIPLEEFAPLKDLSALNSYEFPKPITEKRFVTLKKAVDRFANEKAIIMRIRDVFSTPRDLRGYSRILMDTIQNPSFVSTIVKQIIKHNIEIAKEAVRIDADIIASGDDYADNSGLIMSPQTFRELLLPSFRELVAKVKEDGSFFIKHTDGNIMAIIEDLIDSGIDCIDPIDPLAGMNIEEIKKKYGRKVTINGNIDCVNTLCRHPIKC